MFGKIRDLFRWYKVGKFILARWEEAMSMLSVGDKPSVKSRAWWGAILLVMWQVLEKYQPELSGMLGEPWGQMIPVVVGALGTLLAVLGIRGAVAR